MEEGSPDGRACFLILKTMLENFYPANFSTKHTKELEELGVAKDFVNTCLSGLQNSCLHPVIELKVKF